MNPPASGAMGPPMARPQTPPGRITAQPSNYASPGTSTQTVNYNSFRPPTIESYVREATLSEDDVLQEWPDIAHHQYQRTMMAAMDMTQIDLMQSIWDIDIVDPFTTSKLMVKSYTKNDFRFVTGVEILYGIPDSIKRAMIMGKVHYPYFDEALLPTPVHGYGSGEDRPAKPQKRVCIYAHWLIEKTTWEPPTAKQMEKIVSMVRRYMVGYLGYMKGQQPKMSTADVDLAFTIDSNREAKRGVPLTWDKAESAKGRKRWFNQYNPQAKRQQSINKYEDCEIWLKVMDDWIATIAAEGPDQLDLPMPWAPSETGYTNSAEQRKWEQANTDGCNTLMALVDSVCEVEFPGEFEMRFFVLYDCPAENHAGPAEHILSRLNFSYVPFGGFNGIIGGIQVASSRHAPSEVYRLHRHRDIPTALTRVESDRQKIQAEYNAVTFVKESAARVEEYNEKYAALQEIKERVTEANNRLKQSEENFYGEALSYMDSYGKDADGIRKLQDLSGILERLHSNLYTLRDRFEEKDYQEKEARRRKSGVETRDE